MSNTVNKYIRSSRDIDIHNFNGIRNANKKYQIKTTRKTKLLDNLQKNKEDTQSIEHLNKNKSLSLKINQIEQLKQINHSIYIKKSINSKNTPVIEYKKLSINDNIIDYQINILSKITINNLSIAIPTLIYNLYVYLTNIRIDSPIDTDFNQTNEVSSEFYTNGLILKLDIKPNIKYQIKYQLILTNSCDYINQLKIIRLKKIIYESSARELVEKVSNDCQSSEFGFNSDQIGQNFKINRLQLEITISNWILCSNSNTHYKSFDYALDSRIRKISNISGFNYNNGIIPLKIINTVDNRISGTVTCPIGCYFSNENNIEKKYQKFAITNINIGFESKNQIKLIQSDLTF